MKFTLPLPPSINRTYGINRTSDNPMYKRQVVRDWEYTAGWDIKRQCIDLRKQVYLPLPIPYDIQIGITWFYRVDRDIDAGIKVLFDLLQKQRILVNDRQIRRITHVDIYPDHDKPRVEILIEKYE